MFPPGKAIQTDGRLVAAAVRRDVSRRLTHCSVAAQTGEDPVPKLQGEARADAGGAMPKRFLTIATGFIILIQSCVDGPSCESPSWSGTLADLPGAPRSLAGQYANWTLFAGGTSDIQLNEDTGPIEVFIRGTFPMQGQGVLPKPGTYTIGSTPDLSALVYDPSAPVSDYAIASAGTLTINSAGLAVHGRFDFVLDGHGALAGHHYNAAGRFIATQAAVTVCPGG